MVIAYTVKTAYTNEVIDKGEFVNRPGDPRKIDFSIMCHHWWMDGNEVTTIMIGREDFSDEELA